MCSSASFSFLLCCNHNYNLLKYNVFFNDLRLFPKEIYFLLIGFMIWFLNQMVASLDQGLFFFNHWQNYCIKGIVCARVCIGFRFEMFIFFQHLLEVQFQMFELWPRRKKQRNWAMWWVTWLKGSETRAVGAILSPWIRSVFVCSSSFCLLPLGNNVRPPHICLDRLLGSQLYWQFYSFYYLAFSQKCHSSTDSLLPEFKKMKQTNFFFRNLNLK